MRYFKHFMMLSLGAVMLSSCQMNWQDDKPRPVLLETSLARAVQEGMMARPAGQVKIYTAMLMVGGKSVQVNNTEPFILSSTGTYDHQAITAFRFSADGNDFTFFSRDPRTGEAYRLIVPVRGMEKTKPFDFPVLHNGQLSLMKIYVVDVVRKLDQPLPIEHYRLNLITPENDKRPAHVVRQDLMEDNR